MQLKDCLLYTSNQGGGRGDSRPGQVGLRGSDLELLTTYAQDLAERIRPVSYTHLRYFICFVRLVLFAWLKNNTGFLFCSLPDRAGFY